jgi:hypothetical protein
MGTDRWSRRDDGDVGAAPAPSGTLPWGAAADGRTRRGAARHRSLPLLYAQYMITYPTIVGLSFGVSMVHVVARKAEDLEALVASDRRVGGAAQLAVSPVAPLCLCSNKCNFRK